MAAKCRSLSFAVIRARSHGTVLFTEIHWRRRYVRPVLKTFTCAISHEPVLAGTANYINLLSLDGVKSIWVPAEERAPATRWTRQERRCLQLVGDVSPAEATEIFEMIHELTTPSTRHRRIVDLRHEFFSGVDARGQHLPQEYRECLLDFVASLDDRELDSGAMRMILQTCASNQAVNHVLTRVAASALEPRLVRLEDPAHALVALQELIAVRPHVAAHGMGKEILAVLRAQILRMPDCHGHAKRTFIALLRLLGKSAFNFQELLAYSY